MLTYYNNYVPLVQLKIINMPRQARKTSGTGIYHVMLRGINRQDIFEDDEDYMKFLQSLHQLVECYDERGYRIPSLCHFYAYCLMPNHVHLLIQHRSGDGSLIRPELRKETMKQNNKRVMRPRSRIQTTGPNNGHQLRDYSKSSNRSESPDLSVLS